MPVFKSVLEHTYDVAVVGTGFAGLAAAMALDAAGKRVLLLESRGRSDLLWESGRAFYGNVGVSESALWPVLREQVSAVNGWAEGHLDGAITEVVSTRMLMNSGVRVLYYTVPVATERDTAGELAGLIVGSKSGYQRVVAEQWIDATDEALLASLLGTTVSQPERTLHGAIHLHASQWDLDAWEGAASDTSLSLTNGLWTGEKVLQVRWQGTEASWWDRIEPALLALRGASEAAAKRSVVSHLSCEPLALGGALSLEGELPANVAFVATQPGLETLTGRLEVGELAVGRLAGAPHAQTSAVVQAALPVLEVSQVVTADVAVAGAGTGGAIAAISAGRQGVSTVCVEPLSFAGGIGSGGGIHNYYFGFPGGIQSEMDDRVRELMEIFAGSRKQVRGFHPDAKKLALHTMMKEAGVTFITSATLVGARTVGGKVTRAEVALPGRLLGLDAKTYIDSTGDGDLAAKAGATFWYGRPGDGNVHAYSQSSGKIALMEDGLYRMVSVNYDAGWVDPTDVEDLTRGRLVGINQYLNGPFEAHQRPTYIAPAIGLRQSRQIDTDYVLTMTDIVEHREFADSIGRSGAHYDNHAVDYEFENDEGMFWVWGLHNWRNRTHSGLPYRIMLPKGLDNVWIACRAVGVSEDAHHSMRMQRDIQRLGEAAAYAASLAVKHGCGSRELPWSELNHLLEASGALDPERMKDELNFGCFHDLREIANEAPPRISEARLQEGIAALVDPTIEMGLWYLYRAETLPPEVLEALTSDDDDISWRAALVLAMRHDPAAEPRLLRAVATLEDGEDRIPAGKASFKQRFTVRFLVAAALLRRCGTPACIAPLGKLLTSLQPALNVLTTVALTAERLAPTLGAKACLPLFQALAKAKVQEDLLGPQRKIQTDPSMGDPQGPHPTSESHSWQFRLIMARLAKALDQPTEAWLRDGLMDERRLVRRQFEAVVD